MISFFVRGTPIAQPRPQVSTRGGFARAYVPAKHPVHAWRKAVRDACPYTEKLEGPLSVTLSLFLPRPKSHYRTGKHAGHLKASAPIWHSSRSDVDNHVKSVLDALDGVAWIDDAQVCRLRAEKRWDDGEGPRAWITIELIE